MLQEHYEVIARKWRPQRFDDVIGQRHITETLKNEIQSGRIAHAFLFSGINIAVSAFFTALQKAKRSLCIALLRALILPIGFVFTISYFFEFHLLYIVLWNSIRK